MGSYARGILAYGYDLGCDEEWLVREAGEYGELELDWYDPEADGEDDDTDFATLAERRLLVASGFTETYEDGRDGYFDRERAAKEATGVEIYQHCSGDYPMYLLVTKTLTASQGHVEDAAAFLATVDDKTRQEWDAKLKHACDVLGMTPEQAEPKWLLAAEYG